MAARCCFGIEPCSHVKVLLASHCERAEQVLVDEPHAHTPFVQRDSGLEAAKGTLNDQRWTRASG